MVFAGRSQARAAVFRDSLAMMKDAALHYPEGMQAQLLKGQAAARRGDAAAATRAFARAVDLGFADLAALLQSPDLVAVRGDPGFREVLLDLARRDIERLGQQDRPPTQEELRQLSLAYTVRGQLPEAIRSLERALELGGARDDDIRGELEGLRRQRSARGSDGG